MELIDLHIHGAPWSNGWANYRRSVWQAWRNGLHIAGLSEHGPRFNYLVPFRSLSLAELDKYFHTIEEIRLEFAGEIEVLSGLELDYNQRMVEYYSNLLPRLPLDYVIGAIHSVEDWIPEIPQSYETSALAGKNAEQLYQAYFQKLTEAAQSGLFDFIAHPDLVKKALPHLGMKKPDNLQTLYQETAKMLAACDVGIEINTRGKLLPDVGEFYPHIDFLTECRRAGVHLTIGSDAHQPQNVGLAVEEAFRLAQSLGFAELSVWRKRKRYVSNLSN